MARPVLLVIGGPNGAGKTTLTITLRKERWSEGVEYLNPDDIARDRFGDWNSPAAQESQAIASRLASHRLPAPLGDRHPPCRRAARLRVTKLQVEQKSRIEPSERRRSYRRSLSAARWRP